MWVKLGACSSASHHVLTIKHLPGCQLHCGAPQAAAMAAQQMVRTKDTAANLQALTCGLCMWEKHVGGFAPLHRGVPSHQRHSFGTITITRERKRWFNDTSRCLREGYMHSCDRLPHWSDQPCSYLCNSDVLRDLFFDI